MKEIELVMEEETSWSWPVSGQLLQSVDYVIEPQEEQQRHQPNQAQPEESQAKEICFRFIKFWGSVFLDKTCLV